MGLLSGIVELEDAALVRGDATELILEAEEKLVMPDGLCSEAVWERIRPRWPTS